MLDVIRRTAESIFIPFTVGGGVRSVDDFLAILGAGADKVGVNTAALQRPELVARAADRFGSQCVVVAIDARRAEERTDPRDAPRWEVYTHGGRIPTGSTRWSGRAAWSARRGGDPADLDGYRRHPRRVRPGAAARRSQGAVGIPVIASGGAGTLEHLDEALAAGAHAVLAASIFHFGEITIPEARKFLAGAEVDRHLLAILLQPSQVAVPEGPSLIVPTWRCSPTG
jgi:imidazole glycerol-phosphate synthase subunit HisF